MLASDNKKLELQGLIKGLAAHEKAYFKKLAKRYAENNQALHIKLFELIDTQPEYNEQAFVKKLKLKSPSQYSALKNQLWNEIISVLIFQKRNDASSQLEFAMMQADILLSKNLVISASRVLNIAWKHSETYELYYAQPRLIHFKYKILAYTHHKHYHKENDLLLQQQDRMSKRLHCEQQLKMFERELTAMKRFSYLRLSDQQLSRVKEIEQSLLDLEIDPDTCLLRLLQQYGLCIAAHLTYRFDASEQYAHILLQIWQQNTHLIPYNETVFINSADYTFYNSFALKDTTSAENYLTRYNILAIQFLKPNNRSYWDIISFNTQLKIYHKTANYTAVKKLIEREAIPVIKKATRILPPAVYLSIISSVCISHFVLEQFEAAEDLLIDVLNINREVQREDILYFTATFHLLILYERKNQFQLGNAINSTYARLYNQKKLHPFEKELMLFLKHLSNEVNNEGKRNAIKLFLLKLEDYKNDPVKDLYFLYFNYYGWLESKTRKMRYTEYIAEQVALSRNHKN